MLATLASSARVAIYPDGYHMLTRNLGARMVLEDPAAWLADPAAPCLPATRRMGGRRFAAGTNPKLAGEPGDWRRKGSANKG